MIKGASVGEASESRRLVQRGPPMSWSLVDMEGQRNATLGARDFSSAVYGFCQVFVVTQLRPTAEDSVGLRQERIKGTEKASPMHTLFHRLFVSSYF